VSSHAQRQDLERQKAYLENYLQDFDPNYEIISDLGSGLNFKKKGLNKLIKMIISGEVSKLVVTHFANSS